MAKEPTQTKTIEAWAAEKKTSELEFAMAKVAIWRSVTGVEVDEKAFDAAIVAVGKAEMKGY